MANRAVSTADAWIEVGYELFGEGGPAAVRIEEIAKRLGVSRSGFYHRFENRGALLEAINDRWMADGMDAYVRAGALENPEARLPGYLVLLRRRITDPRVAPNQRSGVFRIGEARGPVLFGSGQLVNHVGAGEPFELE